MCGIFSSWSSAVLVSMIVLDLSLLFDVVCKEKMSSLLLVSLHGD